MIIAGIQLAVSRESRANNIAKAQQWIRKAAAQGAKIVCLQEFFSTGCFTREKELANFQLAETVQGSTVSSMAALAKELDIHILVPFMEQDAFVKGRYYNSVAIAGPDGKIAGQYRKLFIPQNAPSYEKYYFTPGNLGVPVFTAGDVRFGVAICYDLYFFEVHRILALKGADIVFIPMSSSKGRQYLWEAQLTSVAWNNGLYVVGVNSTGHHEKPHFGNSMIVDPFGKVQDRLGEEEGIVFAEYSAEKVTEARNTSFVLRDQRPDLLDELRRLYGQ